MSKAANNQTTPARKELNIGDTPIEQKPPIENTEDFEADTILVDAETASDLNKRYLNLLAFNEEPVTIRIEPSSEKFAPSSIPCWNNGKGAEALVNGKWVEITYVPVGIEVTLKRKYVEQLSLAKMDSIETEVLDRNEERPRNFVKRFTSSISLFSIIEDKNPMGRAWAQELRRRKG